MAEKLKVEVIGDIGNSAAKVSYIGNAKFSRKVHTIINKILTLPEFINDKDTEEIISKLHDDLIVDISSPSITQDGIYAVGLRAFSSKEGVKSTFNIDSLTKQDHDISIVVPTALIAASAIQDYYMEHKEVPSALEVEVGYRTALPLAKFSQERVDTLRGRLMANPHIVKVLVQGKFIEVTVTYTKTKIEQEGLPTIYAVLRVPQLLKATTLQPKDLLKRNVLSLDIGEGTTEGNFVVQGKVDKNSSEGGLFGVGHAVVRAIDKYISDLGLDIKISRQEFMRVYLDGTHAQHRRAKAILEDANKAEAHNILAFVKQRYIALQANVNVIIVSGGGATVFREILEPLLKDFCDKNYIDLIWIEAEHADMLNCIGMGTMAMKEQETQPSAKNKVVTATEETV